MFLTLILQYLNKLVEGEIRDLASPKPFHAIKVQRFNGNRIKLLTKFRGNLPLKVFALVGDFTVETGNLPHTPPPTVRPFLLTAKCFVEMTKLVQRLFQRLWVLDLLTRGKCQVSVFHAEVCPNALTCCWQRAKICVGCYDIKPIVAATITLDRDTTDSAVPLAVLMKRICHFIILPLTCSRIPFTKPQRDTIVFQRPTRTSRVGDRLELVSGFPFRFPTKFFEKTHIGKMYPFQFLLNRLAWQGVPMRVCGALQIRQVCGHRRVVRIRQAISIPLVLPPMEIVMHLPHIVKQIADTDTIRLIAKLILIRFHGISSIKSLTPFQWVGRHVTGVPTRYREGGGYAGNVCQLDTLNYTIFLAIVKCFFNDKPNTCLHPAS